MRLVVTVARTCLRASSSRRVFDGLVAVRHLQAKQAREERMGQQATGLEISQREISAAAVFEGQRHLIDEGTKE